MASATPTLVAAPEMQHSEGWRTLAIRTSVAHLLCVSAFFLPAPPGILLAALAAFFIRVFIVEGGAHRYFAHRAYKTSRVFQALLAAGVAACSQRGPLWWAMIHRRHHRNSDGPGDPHSPILKSPWQAYFGWLLNNDTLATNLVEVKDLARFPELVWINKYHQIFPLLTLAATYLLGEYTALFGAAGLGWSAVIWVFLISTLASVHMIYIVNFFAHGNGPVNFWQRRTFETADHSRNIWWWAIPSLGGGWHNNHHRYMNTARAGFYWYEIDGVYYILRALKLLGVVWDLREVPPEILAEGRRR